MMEAKWMAKNSKPIRPGWHYTRNHNGSIAARYYDDTPTANGGTWWTATARNGWKPNDSFVEWMNIPGISDKQH